MNDQETATRQEHDDLAPHKGCTCKLCVALREARDWEESAGFTAVMRDEFARALVEIEARATILKNWLNEFPHDAVTEPHKGMISTITDSMLGICTGSIGKTASPADMVAELERANTGLAQESHNLQTVLAQIEVEASMFRVDPPMSEDELMAKFEVIAEHARKALERFQIPEGTTDDYQD